MSRYQIEVSIKFMGKPKLAKIILDENLNFFYYGKDTDKNKIDFLSSLLGDLFFLFLNTSDTKLSFKV